MHSQPTLPSSRKRRAVLTRMQSRQLEDAIERDWKEIADRQLSRREYARQYSRANNVPVNHKHVSRSMEVLGKEWPGSNQRIASDNARTTMANKVTADAILHLAEKLGYTLPQQDDLLYIARN